MDTNLLEPEFLLAAPDEAAIQSWLALRIAERVGMPVDEIEIDLPFSYYGLDSVAAVGLSGELEDWLGRKLPPTLTWDYPSIEALAAHLALEPRH